MAKQLNFRISDEEAAALEAIRDQQAFKLTTQALAKQLLVAAIAAQTPKQQRSVRRVP